MEVPRKGAVLIRPWRGNHNEADNYKTTEEPIEAVPQSIKLTVKLAPEFGRLSPRRRQRMHVFFSMVSFGQLQSLSAMSRRANISCASRPKVMSHLVRMSKLGQKRAALKLKLQGAEPPCVSRCALDTGYPKNSEYCNQLQTVSARNGRLDRDTNRNFDLKTQSESIAMLGFELSAGWEASISTYLESGYTRQVSMTAELF